MNIVSLILSITGSFVLMELASWFIHKYIMHGPLWNIHKTHHQHRKGSWLELNDLFTIFFGGMAIFFLIRGLALQNPFLTGAGIGISLYGLTYFILHDVFIHRRIKIFSASHNPLLRALADAHRDHHKSREKDGSTSFGLLLVHKQYYKKYLGRKEKKT